MNMKYEMFKIMELSETFKLIVKLLKQTRNYSKEYRE